MVGGSWLILHLLGWTGRPLLLGLFVLTAAAMGLLSGAIFNSAEAAAGMGIVLVLAMSALGGCWWPSEVVPGWLRLAGYVEHIDHVVSQVTADDWVANDARFLLYPAMKELTLDIASTDVKQ